MWASTEYLLFPNTNVLVIQKYTIKLISHGNAQKRNRVLSSCSTSSLFAVVSPYRLYLRTPNKVGFSNTWSLTWKNNTKNDLLLHGIVQIFRNTKISVGQQILKRNIRELFEISGNCNYRFKIGKYCQTKLKTRLYLRVKWLSQTK